MLSFPLIRYIYTPYFIKYKNKTDMLCESFNFETYMKKYIYRYREVQLSQTPEGGLILYTVSMSLYRNFLFSDV